MKDVEKNIKNANSDGGKANPLTPEHSVHGQPLKGEANKLPAVELASNANNIAPVGPIFEDPHKQHGTHHKDHAKANLGQESQESKEGQETESGQAKGLETLLSQEEVKDLDLAAEINPLMNDEGSSFIANGFGSLDIVEDDRYDWTKVAQKEEERPDLFILNPIAVNDIPTIELNLERKPVLVVGDSDFSTDAKASYAEVFSPNIGNDGFKDSDNNGIPDADAIKYTLGISGGGDPSGLIDTLTNDPVLLYLNIAGVVEGRIGGPQGELVFTISVDAMTGEVTLDQLRSVVHNDPTDSLESYASGSAAGLSAPELVTLTLTIKDINLDVASKSADIGDTFKFEDDGPSITLNNPNNQERNFNLVTDDTEITDNAGPVSFDSLFSYDFGNDGAKDEDDNDDTGTISDPDAISYALEINPNSNDTLLLDTLTHDPVLLFLEGGNIVGRVGGDAGDIVFTISINSATGEVSLEQNRSIVHNDANDPVESAASGSAAELPADLVRIVANIIDGDLDHVSAAQNIGQFFKFEDDGPEIHATEAALPNLSVTEPSEGQSFPVSSAPTSYAGLFAHDFGKDSFKDSDDNDIEDEDAIKYELSISADGVDSGLDDIGTGTSILLYKVGDDIVGKTDDVDQLSVFSISINTDTGEITLTQYRAIANNESVDIQTPITLTAIITDGDGDTDTASRDITGTFVFTDGNPNPPEVELGPPSLLIVDDTFIPVSSDTKSFAQLFVSPYSFGPDGPANVDPVLYSLKISAEDADSGIVDTLSNEAVHLFLEMGAVVGRTDIGHIEVFRITIDPVSGDVTLQQSRSIVHNDPNDSAETQADGSAAGFLSADLVKLQVTLTDGDGTQASSTANIGTYFRFEDDGPSIDTNEENVQSLIVDDTNIPNSAGPVSFAGLFTHDFGKDDFKDSDNNDIQDPDAIKYSLNITDIDSGLVDSLSHEAVHLYLILGEVVGKTAIGGDEVFRISVGENTGEVSLTQSRPIEHSNDLDKTLSNNLITLTATITDGDFDTDSAVKNIGGAFVFKDDQPGAVDDCHICDPNMHQEIPSEWSINISFLGTNAGYNNSFGYYIKDANGNPIDGNIIWAGVKDGIDNTDYALNNTMFPSGFDPCDIGYFIIPNGFNQNGGAYQDNLAIKFEYVQVGGYWQAYYNEGNTKVIVNGQDAQVFFDNGGLNIDNYTHFNYIGDGDILNPNTYNWEDLYNGGDADFNDLKVSIQNNGFVCDPCDHPNSILIGNLMTNDNLSIDNNINRVYEIKFTDVNNVEHIYAIPQVGVFQTIQPGFVLLLNSDGSYTFNLTNPLPVGETVFFEYRLIDGDGSLSNWAEFCFNVLPRTTPILSIIAATPDDIIVDETILANNTTINFADNFIVTPDFGADGPSTTVPPLSPMLFTLSTLEGDSGLNDTITGQKVILSMNGGVVEGRTESSNELVFTVKVDSTGNVTLDQIRSVVHPDENNTDESVTLNQRDPLGGIDPATLVKLTGTQTITDSTGDSQTVSANINIGTSLIFKDDAPSFMGNENSAAPLVVADRDLVTNAKASFASLFTPNFGGDGPKDSDHNGVADPDAIQYSLGLNSDPSHNNSGVKDTESGLDVFLFLEGGKVVGHAGNASGPIVFTISVDTNTGEVTLDQVRAVVHNDPDDAIETGASAVGLATADLINIKVTITDGDLDKSSQTRDIGDLFKFEDAGPSIDIAKNTNALASLEVDETNLGNNATANFAGNFSLVSSSYGADGAGIAPTTSYSLSVIAGDSGLIDVASGQKVILSVNGSGVVEGRTELGNVLVFTVAVNGSGEVTLDQIQALKHALVGNDPNDAVTLSAANLVKLTATATIVDRDGDSKSDFDTLNIGQSLIFRDDDPSLTVTASPVLVGDALTVDESNLSLDATRDFSGKFTVVSAYGADGAGTAPLNYALSVIAGPSGLVDVASGQNVILSMNGLVVEGRTQVSNALVFTVSVSSAGIVKLDQIQAVKHLNTSDPDDSTTLSAANLIKLSASVTITDKDGDALTKSANLDIGQSLIFKDDGSSIVLSSATVPTLTVDDTTLSVNPTSTSGSFAALFTPTPGADGYKDTNHDGVKDADAVKYTLGINSGNSGIVDTLTGSPVVLSLSGGIVYGKVGSLEVFKISVNTNTGDITLDQIRPIKHTGDADKGFANANLITLTATVTDGDLDTASATKNIGGAFIFKDDQPIAVDDSYNFDPNTTPVVPNPWQIKINFVDTNAGYNNSFGYYVKDPVTGEPLFGKIIWEGVKDGVANGEYILNQDILPGVNPYNIGYFIVPDGFNQNSSNSAYKDNASVTFSKNSSGDWQAKTGSTLVYGYGDGVASATSIFFDNANLNIDGYTHYNFIGQGTPNSPNHYNWEDIYNGGDADFNDIQVTVQTTFGADPSSPSNTIFTGNLITNDDPSEDLPNRIFKIRYSESDNIGEIIPTNGVYQNNAHGFVLLLNADGSYTFNLTTATTQTGENVFFQYQLIDADGSTSNWADFSINFLPRNVPTISVVAGAPDQLIVDDTTLATNASSDFSNNFTITKSYGPDGAGTTGSTSPVSYTLSISANAQDTGLNDVATGKDILLKIISGTVYGYYNNGSTDVTVFTVSVNSLGTVTLDQIRAIAHTNSSNPDESITFSGTNAASFIKLTASQTITDSNGDSATSSDSINLGNALNFKDDAPTITSKLDPNSDNIIEISTYNPSSTGVLFNNISIVNWSYGADNAANSNPIVLALNSATSNSTVSLNGTTLTFKNGSNTVATLTLSATGNDELHLVRRTGSRPDLDYNFTLKFVDKEGDFVIQEFKLHLDGSNKPGGSPGYTIDGPIAGATIFQDVNHNAVHDNDESFTLSDHTGAYNILLIDTNYDGLMNTYDGRLVSLGGQDTETNLEYHIPFFAPLGSEIISPLSSIFSLQLDDNRDQNLINQHLVEKLGFASDAILTSLNPMEAAYDHGDMSVLAQAAAIMTLSVQLSEAFGQKLGVLQASVADEIYRAIGDQILSLPNGEVADFTNKDFLHSIVDNASHQLGVNSSELDPIMNLLTESQIALHNSVSSILPVQDSIDLISAVQHFTQGDYAQMISQFYSGGLSAQQLGDLTEALHQYNQENVVHSMGETVLTLEEVVSTLPHITEMIPMIPVSEAALVTPISSSPAYIETTLEPVYVQVSLEGMNIDNPTQPH